MRGRGVIPPSSFFICLIPPLRINEAISPQLNAQHVCELFIPPTRNLLFLMKLKDRRRRKTLVKGRCTLIVPRIRTFEPPSLLKREGLALVVVIDYANVLGQIKKIEESVSLYPDRYLAMGVGM